MKTKWIFGIVAVIMMLSISSISQAEDRFYYGCYSGKDYPSILRGSLRFNIVQDAFTDTATCEIESLAAHSLRAIAASVEEDGPTHWAKISHYTLWEAEGLDESWVGLRYNGGTPVNDPSASGGKAWRFTGQGTLGIIQEGPSYYQEPILWGSFIEYTAEFRLKFHYSLYTPHGPIGPGSPPTTKVCSLVVVDTFTHSILKDTTLYKSDFPGGGHGGYKTFTLANYTVPDTEKNRIEFQIYWFALPEADNFWIDYVKVDDNYGNQLMAGFRDSIITAYVSQDWTKTVNAEGDTVIYRWYLRDEPGTIDLFATNRYIDSLLRVVSTERVGFQAFNKYEVDTLEHEYFLRQDPEEYHVDLYPMRWLGQNFSGETFQHIFSYCTSLLNSSKYEAENREKDFWVTISTFVEGPPADGDTCCPGCSLYYALCEGCDTILYCFNVYKRLPTPYEVRLQTYLAFCYGADAILNFSYLADTMRVKGKRWLRLGLYDKFAGSPTDMWHEIKDFTAPRVEKLGLVFNQLTWQGACSDDEVGSFVPRNEHPNYIDSITSSEEPHWVEVGFFSADTGQYTDYFMLVNRECLESEAADYDVFFTAKRGLYRIRDMYTDSIIAVVNGSGDQFVVHLDPGEGKLFRLEPRLFGSRVIQVMSYS